MPLKALATVLAYFSRLPDRLSVDPKRDVLRQESAAVMWGRACSMVSITLVSYSIHSV